MYGCIPAAATEGLEIESASKYMPDNFNVDVTFQEEIKYNESWYAFCYLSSNKKVKSHFWFKCPNKLQ